MKDHSIFSIKDVQPKVSQIIWELRRGQDNGLLVNALYIFGANLLPGVFGAIFWWFSSRLYSPAEVGIASAIISMALLISNLSKLGLDISVIRYLPSAKDKNLLINSIFSTLIVVGIIVSGIFLSLIPILSPKLISLRGNIVNTLIFIFLVVATTLVGALRAAYVSARNAKYSFLVNLIGPASRIGLVLVFLLFVKNLSTASIVTATLAGVLVSFAAGFHFFLPALIHNYKINFLIDWKLISSILPYSLGNYLTELVIQIPQTLIPLMIINSLGEVSNGHAYVAIMIGLMVSGPGLALGRSAFAEGANSLDDPSKILRKSFLIGGSFSLVIAGIAALQAPWLLSFFGESYQAEATGLLRWLVAACPLIVIVQIFYTKLRLSNKVNILIGLSIMNATVALLVTKIGLLSWGISAAGIGMLTGNLAVFCLIITHKISNKRHRKPDNISNL